MMLYNVPLIIDSSTTDLIAIIVPSKEDWAELL